MLWKPILILLLGVITSDPQTPQLKLPGERQPDALPRELTETETQKILREDSPGPRVDATLINVKVHRGQVIQKMRAASMADLVRLSEKLGIPRATNL